MHALICADGVWRAVRAVSIQTRMPEASLRKCQLNWDKLGCFFRKAIKKDRSYETKYDQGDIDGICLVPDLGQSASTQDQKQMLKEKVAAFKQSLAENQKALRQYAWTESTQLSLKGEVKNTKVEQCQYGPDGKVQKTLLSAPPEKKEMRGLKKRVVEKKTGEMKDYMEDVVALIQQYIPPQSDLIKDDVAGGNASFSPKGADAIQLQFKDFVKQGDVVTFTLNTAAKAIRQVKVDTYMEDAGKGKGSSYCRFSDSFGRHELCRQEEFRRDGQEDCGRRYGQQLSEALEVTKPAFLTGFRSEAAQTDVDAMRGTESPADVYVRTALQRPSD